MRMKTAVATGLWNMRRIAQHAAIARLIHSTGGAPRITAVVTVYKTAHKNNSASLKVLLFNVLMCVSSKC